ncbi:unnamed protein product [Brugia pahangi]|uniref:Ovule protein n=1 Tax=Brugia pahangi TaxID=6280 RepID=A0A0N4T345_BRUPA|nr:unnamed protein product [Brugia pahangi]
MILMQTRPPSCLYHYGLMIFSKFYMNRKDVAKINRYESGEQGKGYQRFSEAKVESMSVKEVKNPMFRRSGKIKMKTCRLLVLFECSMTTSVYLVQYFVSTRII